MGERHFIDLVKPKATDKLKVSEDESRVDSVVGQTVRLLNNYTDAQYQSKDEQATIKEICDYLQQLKPTDLAVGRSNFHYKLIWTMNEWLKATDEETQKSHEAKLTKYQKVFNNLNEDWQEKILEKMGHVLATDIGTNSFFSDEPI